MYSIAQATEQYRKIEVGTVNKFELLVMLFDGAMRFLREARDAIRQHDIRLKAEKIDRVLAIIGELRSSLNPEQGGDFAARMDTLYAYMSQRALEASFQLDPTACDEVIGLIQPLRDAWFEIARRPEPTERDAQPRAPTLPPVLHAQPAVESRAPLELFG